MNAPLTITDIGIYGETPQVKKGNEAKMRKAAEDFEAFFISQMYQHMFAGVKTDGLFGGGHAEEIWRSMLIDEYGKITAKSGGIGIADSVMQFMLKTQQV